MHALDVEGLHVGTAEALALGREVGRRCGARERIDHVDEQEGPRRPRTRRRRSRLLRPCPACASPERLSALRRAAVNVAGAGAPGRVMFSSGRTGAVDPSIPECLPTIRRVYPRRCDRVEPGLTDREHDVDDCVQHEVDLGDSRYPLRGEHHRAHVVDGDRPAVAEVVSLSAKRSTSRTRYPSASGLTLVEALLLGSGEPAGDDLAVVRAR